MVSALLRKRQRLPSRREKVFLLSQMNSLLKHEITVYKKEKEKNLKKKKLQRIKRESISPQSYGERLSENATMPDQLDILE